MIDFNQLILKSPFCLFFVVEGTRMIFWQSMTVTEHETAFTLDS